MPGHLARQTTTPSLPEGEEDHAGGGLGIVLKTVVAPVHRCYPALIQPISRHMSAVPSLTVDNGKRRIKTVM
jgi:hypothetical protein